MLTAIALVNSCALLIAIGMFFFNLLRYEEYRSGFQLTWRRNPYTADVVIYGVILIALFMSGWWELTSLQAILR